MTHAKLIAAVARATGEDFDLIDGRGFSLVDDRPPTSDDEWQELAIDWDELESKWRGEDRLLAV